MVPAQFRKPQHTRTRTPLESRTVGHHMSIGTTVTAPMASIGQMASTSRSTTDEDLFTASRTRAWMAAAPEVVMVYAKAP